MHEVVEMIGYRTILKFLAVPFLALGLGAVTPAKAMPTVDTEMLLLFDVSGSVNNFEFSRLLEGYATAFRSSAVHAAIADTANGIAVLPGQFGGPSDLFLGFDLSSRGDWTIINDAADANAFADALVGLQRRYTSSQTAIGSAIENSVLPLLRFDFDNPSSLYQVIHVAGDGINTAGVDPATARDNALTHYLAGGVDAINGLFVGCNSCSLFDSFRNDVIGGTNPDGSPAFALAAGSFSDDLGSLLTASLAAQIAGPTVVAVPAPGMIAVLGLGFAGLAYTRRRRTA